MERSEVVTREVLLKTCAKTCSAVSNDCGILHHHAESQPHAFFLMVAMPSRLIHKRIDAVRIIIGRPAIRSARTFCSSPTSASAKATGPEIYDVVCVGGGPAGLALLSALRKYTYTIRIQTVI